MKNCKLTGNCIIAYITIKLVNHGDKIMSGISGNFNAGFDLHQMKQGANDRFKAADTDGNEVVSKQEFVDVMERNGLDTNKMDKIFKRMDENGDGQISQSERQDMRNFLEQRLASLTSDEGGPEQAFDAVKSLVESLQNEAHNDDKKQKLQEVLDKIRSEGYDESIMSESLSLINSMIPRVDESV